MDENAQDSWWVLLGYFAFDAGEDHFPRPGQVVRYYRHQTYKADRSHWTQKDLAVALGVSDVSIFQLEKNDRGMDSFSRRRFLCDILKIPPVLLGLAEIPLPAETSDPSLSKKQLTAATSFGKTMDDRASALRLKELWRHHHSSTVAPLFQDIEREIGNLSEFLPFAGSEREKTLELLCGYHILAGNVLRDRKDTQSSLFHLNRAIDFADLLTKKAKEMRADALFRRSGIFRDGPLGSDSPQLLDDARAALACVESLPPELAAVVLVRAGSAELQVAQDKTDRQKALSTFEKATKLLQAGSDGDTHYLFYDQDRLAIDRAWAFTDISWYQQALDELMNIKRRPEKKRRTAFSDILMAKAQIGLGNYPQAAALLDGALDSVIEVRSIVNYQRMRSLVYELKESSFGSNPEVARLMYRLRQPLQIV
jgi:transcriptional regulator with XRE-family HTH domain